MNDKKIQIIDLFSGAGGLSNGFEQTGKFEVVGAVEINKDAIKTYVANHRNNKDIIIQNENEGISDISKIDFKKYLSENELDGSQLVVVGGPPCQGFSNANRQKNYLISGNNQLVKQYARAIEEINPIAFLMENVKAMNSHTHKFFVTHDEAGSIFEYSSEQHLSKICQKTKQDIFWKKDHLVLLETNITELESLIQSILNNELLSPILYEEAHLSRLRSIIRNLKKEVLYKINQEKERMEIEKIILTLETYECKPFIEKNKLNSIINVTIEVLKNILNGKNNNNTESLNELTPFIEVNQLLRYLNELEAERILVTEKAYVEKEDLTSFKVLVGVNSYNIVEYLKVFFESLDYELDSNIVTSSDYFVPQNRQRFMMLGVKKNKVKNHPVELPRKIESPLLPFKVADAILDLQNIVPTKNVSDNILPYGISDGSTIMQKYYRSNIQNDVIYNHINTESEALSMRRFQEIKNVGGKNFHSLSDELKEITYSDSSRTQNTVYLRLDYNYPAPTVINVRKSMWQHPHNPVALSIREAARLQSFKDDFIFKGTKDKQYQQIGNAVPPLLARAVAEQFLYILGEEPVKKLVNEF